MFLSHFFGEEKKKTPYKYLFREKKKLMDNNTLFRGILTTDFCRRSQIKSLCRRETPPEGSCRPETMCVVIEFPRESFRPPTLVDIQTSKYSDDEL